MEKSNKKKSFWTRWLTGWNLKEVIRRRVLGPAIHSVANTVKRADLGEEDEE